MWRPGEAARRRREQEERARRAEEDRVARQRHEQSLGETRRQTSLARRGIWIAVAALLATLLVPLLVPDNPPAPAPAAPVPQEPPVTPSFVAGVDADGAWWVPRALAELGEPPAFAPEPDGQEDHCTEWRPWFARLGAAPAGGGIYVEAAAALGAPVTIVDIEVTVLRRTRVPATLVQCLYGGGGYESASGRVDLAAPDPVVRITDDRDRTFEVARGRDRFVVEPGQLETIGIRPRGTPGHLYEWTATITYVVAARSATRTLGTARDPLRYYAVVDQEPQPAYDWDPVRKRWVRL